MEASQRNKLEFVAHFPELLLEVGNSHIVELLLPVKRRRAVVREQLARELCVNGVGELPRLGKVRCRGFAPKHVGIGRIRQAASNGCIDAPVELEEAFWRALAVNELAVARVSIGEEQPG